MKKMMMSLLTATLLAVPAMAQSNGTRGVCPANSCTDHSYDEAYSARWADQAQSPRSSVVRVSSSPNVRTWGGMRDRHYTLNDFTVRERYPASMNAPYNGADAPSYDGAAKNMYRNMRANNTSEPLPPNTGNIKGR